MSAFSRDWLFMWWWSGHISAYLSWKDTWRRAGSHCLTWNSWNFNSGNLPCLLVLFENPYGSIFFVLSLIYLLATSLGDDYGSMILTASRWCSMRQISFPIARCGHWLFFSMTLLTYANVCVFTRRRSIIRYQSSLKIEANYVNLI